MYNSENFSAPTKATSGRPAYSPALYQIQSAIAKLLVSFRCQVNIRKGQAGIVNSAQIARLVLDTANRESETVYITPYLRSLHRCPVSRVGTPSCKARANTIIIYDTHILKFRSSVVS